MYDLLIICITCTTSCNLIKNFCKEAWFLERISICLNYNNAQTIFNRLSWSAGHIRRSITVIYLYILRRYATEAVGGSNAETYNWVIMFSLSPFRSTVTAIIIIRKEKKCLGFMSDVFLVMKYVDWDGLQVTVIVQWWIGDEFIFICNFFNEM